jgi:hypothetical protein
MNEDEIRELLAEFGIRLFEVNRRSEVIAHADDGRQVVFSARVWKVIAPLLEELREARRFINGEP